MSKVTVKESERMSKVSERLLRDGILFAVRHILV